MAAPVPGWPKGRDMTAGPESPITKGFNKYLAYRASYSKPAPEKWDGPPPASEWRALGRPVEVRTYRAKNQAEASRIFEAEAGAAYAAGYTVAAQSWAPGSWGAGAFLVAIAAILLFGLGLLILAYLVIVKPDGTLTVTFTRSA